MYVEELEEKIYQIVCETPTDAFNEAFLRYTEDNGGHEAFSEIITTNKLGIAYEVWFVSNIPELDDKMYRVRMQATHEQSTD